MQTSLKSFSGKKTEWYREPISAERMNAFCSAIGSIPRGIAPPTLITIARRGEFGILHEMGVPLNKVLHTEQEYSYHSSLSPGDDLIFQTTLAEVQEKKGSAGTFVFFTFETEFRAEDSHGISRALAAARTHLLSRS